MAIRKSVYLVMSALLLLAASGAVALVWLGVVTMGESTSSVGDHRARNDTGSYVVRLSGLVVVDVRIPEDAEGCKGVSVVVARKVVPRSCPETAPSTSNDLAAHDLEDNAGSEHKKDTHGSSEVEVVQVLQVDQSVRPVLARIAIAYGARDGTARITLCGELDFLDRGVLGGMSWGPVDVPSKEEDKPVWSSYTSVFPSRCRGWKDGECELGRVWLRNARGEIEYRFLLRQIP